MEKTIDNLEKTIMTVIWLKVDISPYYVNIY